MIRRLFLFMFEEYSYKKYYSCIYIKLAKKHNEIMLKTNFRAAFSRKFHLWYRFNLINPTNRYFMKKVCVLLLLGVSILSIHAQKNPVYRIGVEIGGGALEGDIMGDKWNMRQDVSGYYYDSYNSPSYYGYGNNSSLMSVGIKPQVSLLNERIDILSGLRFTMFNTKVESYRHQSNGVIYLRTSNPNAVEFYKISNIGEKIGYLSIPLEMNYQLFRRGVFERSRISFFVKAGAEAGIKLYGNANVNFVSEAMQANEKEILQELDLTLNNFYSTFYFGWGVQLTDGNGIQYNCEARAPGTLLTKRNSHIIDPTMFAGVHFSVLFPVQLFLTK